MRSEVTIRRGLVADITAIRQVALACWPIAYREIISAEQISYMLDLMYSEESLRRQIETEGHHFFLALVNGQCVGYASIGRVGADRSKLHKLYVLPETKGTGVGGLLIRHVIELVTAGGDKHLILQVNRRNPAVSFYRHHGFEVTEETILDIGNGFVMDDFIMEKPLTNATSAGT